MPERSIVGWDIGGAHVKAALLQRGVLQDAAQWPCPLWQGTQHLQAVLQQAAARWPLAEADHAVTMTGEMVDLFEHREAGVAQIAALLATALPGPRFFAADGGWPGAADAGAGWGSVASANWAATARHVALALPQRQGLLVDIGSTTTDLIPFAGSAVAATGRSDAERLASGELVYHGVLRTPLCALAPRVPWRGRCLNVMNEFFATTADVYRLLGETDATHDQHPAADGAPKDRPHTEARLARMIGLDARDGNADEWLALARAWRAAQVDTWCLNLQQVAQAHGLGPGSALVAAGCGAFVVPDLAPAGWSVMDYGRDVAPQAPGAAPALRAWARVGAPAVAVAALYARELR